MKVIPQTTLSALLWIVLPATFWAQNPIDRDAARQLLVKAQMLIDSSKYEVADQCADQAYQFFKSAPDAESDLAEAAYLTGRAAHLNRNYPRAKTYLLESKAVWTHLAPNGSMGTVKTYIALGTTLLFMEDAEASLEEANKALSMLNRLSIETGYERVGAMRLIARNLYGTGQYHKAIPYYEEALRLARLHFGAENREMALMMIYLGNCYNYTELQERAIATLERALTIQQKMPTPIPEEIAGIYMALGSCQQSLKQYEIALEYYEKAAAIRQQIDSPRLAYAYSKIGQVCLEKQDYEKALDYFKRESEVLTHHGLVNGSVYAYNCRDFGLAYLGLKEYQQSIEWLQKAWALFQGPGNDGKLSMGLDQCQILLQIGQAQAASGDYAAAKGSFMENQNLLLQLIGLDYPMLYESNAELGKCFAQFYLQTGQDSLLEKSRTYFKTAEKGVEKLLRNSSYSGSENMLLAEALPYFEHAIDTELLFLNSTPADSASLENAWQFSESMHAQLLFNAVQEANARQFAGIPDAYLKRDSSLQIEIAAIEKEQKSLAEAGRQRNDSLVLEVNARLFAKKEAAYDLRTSFEQNYPDYFRLKYALQNSSLVKTQQMLSPQQTLLEFFVGDASIFVFVVKPKQSQIIKIPKDFPLAEWVHTMREGISGYHVSAQKSPALYQNTLRQYAGAAQQLYDKLLLPIAESLSPELIIVPGESLYNLPFEALLSTTPKDLGNFGTYPFLLKKHVVHYAYSATMLHQMMERRHRLTPSDGILAFAPFFEQDTASLATRLRHEAAFRLGFSALPFSGEEVFRAKTRYGGTSRVWLAESASKQKFLEQAAKYRILHLATHGKANHVAGEFSFLAFSDLNHTDDHGLLSVGELYNLPVNADLVVLSACETGIGEQQRGEGVLSLARAFAFAGAKSIVASLWSVNDQSTMKVMDGFYKEIKSGKSKNVALANAKREYLQQNPGSNAHPFFWAGFVALGDMEPLKN